MAKTKTVKEAPIKTKKEVQEKQEKQIKAKKVTYRNEVDENGRKVRNIYYYYEKKGPTELSLMAQKLAEEYAKDKDKYNNFNHFLKLKNATGYYSSVMYRLKKMGVEVELRKFKTKPSMSVNVYMDKYEYLKNLAHQKGVTLLEILDEIIEEYISKK